MEPELNATYRPQRTTRLDFVDHLDVIVGDRVRESLGDIAGLQESIAFFGGVLQPIALLDIEKAAEPINVSHPDKPNAKYLLIAGHRRFFSCVTGGHNPIEAIIFEGWTMEDLWSAELHENTMRLDFSPIEEDKAVARAHRLLSKVAASNNEIHSVRKTAEYLNLSLKATQDALKRAKAVEKNPRLAKAKTKKEITKHIDREKRKDTLEQIRKLTELQRMTEQKEGTFGRLIDAYHVGDWLEADLTPSTYDLVELDPPYAIGLIEKRKVLDSPPDVRMGAYNDMTSEEYIPFIRQSVQKAFDLIKENGWLILWGDLEWYEFHFNLLQEVGFTTERYDFAFWGKPTGQCRAAHFHFASAAEMFLFARKGSPHIILQGRKNWFDWPVPVRTGRHATEKPIELYEEILARFLPASAKVLSPCLGSGNIILAGENLLLNVEGFDIVQENRDDFLFRAKTWPTPYKSFRASTT